MNLESLEDTERTTFRIAADTGLWDVLIACFVSMLAIGPLLSARLGDFWSSAVFLPVWLAVYVAIRIVHARVVEPRIGRVRFGAPRKERLRRLSLVMLAVNLVALTIGLFAAFSVATVGLWIYPIVFAAVLLVGFSLAAHLLGIPRLFVYGVTLAVAPIAGEWMFRNGYASHHGYPVVYGIAATVMAAMGLVRFYRQVLRRRPAPAPPAEFHDHA